MSGPTRLGFDDALRRATGLATTGVPAGRDVTLVRDVIGRFTVVVDDDPSALAPIEERVQAALGRYARRPAVRSRSDVPWVSELERLPETVVLDDTAPGAGRLLLVERTITGAEWARPEPATSRNRVTLYGFKGGVGRSTATFLLAEHLAMSGRCVLVVDLDLESPGIGSLLQSEDELPEHGIVDHLMESAVGSGLALDLVARSRRARSRGNGEVWLTPAAGRPRDGYSYLPKLNRVYVDAPGDLPSDPPTEFASRLDAAVDACAAQVASRSRSPDVVLMDSRAGIHDIAAVAITRLADLSLLFAADTPQTWAGYRELFREWCRRPAQAQLVRERLKLVAVHVATSEDARAEQLTGFRDRAQACFAETLYDEAGADELSGDVFSFSRDDEAAPHWPLPIPHVPGLVGLDPGRDGWQDDGLVREAYSEFTDGVDALLDVGDA